MLGRPQPQTDKHLRLCVLLHSVQNLRNPGMRTRHWDQLTTDLGRDMHFDSSFTLDAALKQGLLAHLDQISKVSDVASKEYSIEQVGHPAGRVQHCIVHMHLQ